MIRPDVTHLPDLSIAIETLRSCTSQTPLEPTAVERALRELGHVQQESMPPAVGHAQTLVLSIEQISLHLEDRSHQILLGQTTASPDSIELLCDLSRSTLKTWVGRQPIEDAALEDSITRTALNLASVYFVLDQMDRAEDLLILVANRAARREAPVTSGKILLAAVYLKQGRLAYCETQAEEIFEADKGDLSPSDRAHVASILGTLRYLEGRFEESIRLFESVRPLAKRVREWTFEETWQGRLIELTAYLDALFLEAHAQARVGSWSAALSLLEALDADLDGVIDSSSHVSELATWYRLPALALMIRVASHLGRGELASRIEGRCLEACRDAVNSTASSVRILALATMARVGRTALDRHAIPEARELFEWIRDSLQRPSQESSHAWEAIADTVSCALARTELLSGDLDAATAWVEKAQERLGHRDQGADEPTVDVNQTLLRVGIACTRGQIAACRGNQTEAVRALQEARDYLDTFHATLDSSLDVPGEDPPAVEEAFAAMRVLSGDLSAALELAESGHLRRLSQRFTDLLIESDQKLWPLQRSISECRARRDRLRDELTGLATAQIGRLAMAPRFLYGPVLDSARLLALGDRDEERTVIFQAAHEMYIEECQELARVVHARWNHLTRGAGTPPESDPDGTDLSTPRPELVPAPAALAQDSVAIAFLLEAPGPLALCIDGRTGEPSTYDLPDETRARVNEVIHDQSLAGSDSPEATAKLVQLSRCLFTPSLLASLDEGRRIHLVATGIVSRIPFSRLPLPDEPNRRIIDRNPVVNAPTFSLSLAQTIESLPATVDRSRALSRLIGEPSKSPV